MAAARRKQAGLLWSHTRLLAYDNRDTYIIPAKHHRLARLRLGRLEQHRLLAEDA